MNGYVYSVNLFEYTQATVLNRSLYWGMFAVLIVVGIIKLLLAKLRMGRDNKLMTKISMLVSVLLVLFLVITREVYPVIIVFLLLVIKAVLIIRYAKK